MRTYTYDPKIYNRKITFTGWFCLAILVYSVIQLVSGSNPAIWIGVVIVSTYTVWETFISLSNPSQVVVSDEKIIFRAYGREHEYRWDEITRFRAKEFTGARKIFLRINKAGILRGRYWLHCYYFNDTEELYQMIVDQENRIHPDSIKARAKNGSGRSVS